MKRYTILKFSSRTLHNFYCQNVIKLLFFSTSSFIFLPSSSPPSPRAFVVKNLKTSKAQNAFLKCRLLCLKIRFSCSMAHNGYARGVATVLPPSNINQGNKQAQEASLEQLSRKKQLSNTITYKVLYTFRLMSIVVSLVQIKFLILLITILSN